jgi:hypothetical protein
MKLVRWWWLLGGLSLVWWSLSCFLAAAFDTPPPWVQVGYLPSPGQTPTRLVVSGLYTSFCAIGALYFGLWPSNRK